MRMVSVAVATPRACRVDRVLGGVRPDFSSSPQTFSCANHCVFEIIWMLAKYSVQEFKTQCGELEIQVFVHGEHCEAKGLMVGQDCTQ
jgi:hypothetical protein